MRHIRPAVIVAAVLAGALVLVGMWLAINGLPERTPTQRLMLGLSQVAFALAALVAIIEMAWERRAWRRRSFRIVAALAGLLVATAILLLVGRGVLGWGRPADGVTPGLGWTGIALLFGWLVIDTTRQDRRLRRRYIAEGEAMED
ncbi:hypothetical protein [Enemella sp. A6]|uniref:hypothetical protein n=1 Tax=Enemella sp. A6 TaxID=3440152 RepID=UPI003EB7EC16